MYYYSKQNHRKIIHTENCYIAKRFDPEATGTFQTLHEAFSAGYRLCRHCNPIVKQFRKEENLLYDYCYSNGMSFRSSDRYFSVTSTTSKWLITVSATGQTLLYHKNTKKLDTDALSAIPGYHNQRIMFGTLLEYFEYIKNHDWYRQMHPEKPVKVRNSEKEPPRMVMRAKLQKLLLNLHMMTRHLQSPLLPKRCNARYLSVLRR